MNLDPETILESKRVVKMLRDEESKDLTKPTQGRSRKRSFDYGVYSNEKNDFGITRRLMTFGAS